MTFPTCAGRRAPAFFEGEPTGHTLLVVAINEWNCFAIGLRMALDGLPGAQETCRAWARQVLKASAAW